MGSRLRGTRDPAEARDVHRIGHRHEPKATPGGGDGWIIEPVLRLFHKPQPEGMLHELDVSLLGSIEQGWFWLDMSGEDPHRVASLCRRFGFEELAIEDALESTQFPKVDDYEDYLFVVLHGLSAREERLDTAELDVFLGENFLVTIHAHDLPAIEWVLERAMSFERMATGGPDRMLARIAEAQSSRYLPVIATLEERLDDLEERSIGGDPATVGENLALRRDATTLRRVVGPQRDVLLMLGRDPLRVIGDRARLRFHDAFDQHVRLVESLDASRQNLALMLETYRSTVAESTNEVMRLLTVFAAILLPLGLVAGIYGMNFTNMPALSEAWGFYAVMGLMLVIAISEWIYFARRGFVGKFRPARIPRRVGSGLAHLATLPVRAVAGLVEQIGPRRDEAD